MAALRKALSVFIVCIIIGLVASASVLAASAKISKKVTPLDNGNFLIKLNVQATRSGIYGFKLIDPQASIVDVYAPKGWCVVSDGEDFMARTRFEPIRSGKSLEFIIHSKTDDIHYTWSVFGRIKQLGSIDTL